MFYLVGMPAVGKYTIAKELAALTGARLVDNHSIANVIFNIVGVDGIKPLPDGTFDYVGRVRAVAVDAIRNLVPRDVSFVFTLVLVGDNEREAASFDRDVALARDRESLFVPVLLRCETPELMLRADNGSRQERMKLIDPAMVANINDTYAQFETDHPNTLRLETTNTPPAENARHILAWAERLDRAQP
jgi:predicted kinase